MNVITLKKMIYDFLKTVADRVYDTQAPARVTYPYVVFVLESSLTDLNQVKEDFDLDISVYDNSQFDKTRMDTLIGAIDGNGAITSATGLHRKHFYSNNLQADVYRVSRGIDTSVTLETDQNITTVQLMYDVHAYLT